MGEDMSTTQTNLPPCVILAGGRARRMGGIDKVLAPLGGRPMLTHLCDRLLPQAPALALNANGDPQRFDAFGLPVLPDGAFLDHGPLAGILAAMGWAAALGAGRVVTVSCDCPFLPMDFVDRLMSAVADGTPVAVAATVVDAQSVVPHPTCAIWSTDLAPALRTALLIGKRRVLDFADRHDAARVVFSGAPFDPFLNINTAADLAQANRLVEDGLA